MYKTKSAILFVLFNRPDTTARVFEQIKIAQPKRLYVAADGPRSSIEGEAELCEQARATIKVDWDCEVKTLYNTENKGCRNGVSAAIDWFFAQEQEGIILEDDCLPSNSFFKFCDILLERYRGDTRIKHITGCNLQQGKKWGNGSYYFSNRTHVWGWACWKRVWDDYDITLGEYNAEEMKVKIKDIFDDDLVVDSWMDIFAEVKAGTVDSWAYPLDFINFWRNGLTIIPNENLISNIGFKTGATNTPDADNVFANVPLAEIDNIVHPETIAPKKEADLFIINSHFNIEEKRRRHNLLRRRFKRWVKGMFKKNV